MSLPCSSYASSFLQVIIVSHWSLVIDNHLSNLVMLFFLQWGFKSCGSGAGTHAANGKKEKLTMMR
jgi:hypothetical protein